MSVVARGYASVDSRFSVAFSRGDAPIYAGIKFKKYPMYVNILRYSRSNFPK